MKLLFDKKIAGVFIGLSLLSCGRSGTPNSTLQNRSDSASTLISAATACIPNAQPPTLYYYFGGIAGDDSDVKKHFVVGLPDQACQEKLIYLEACTESSAKALLGFYSTPAADLGDSRWLDYIKNDPEEKGDYYRFPHINCTNAVNIKPKLEPNQKPEVHIISGKDGYSSLSVIANGQGQLVHYKAPHSCLSLRRKLNAEAYMTAGDANVLLPLKPKAGEDVIHLNCAKERAPIQAKEGWRLAKTTNSGLKIYLAQYRATATGPASELAISNLDGVSADEADELEFETALLKVFGLDRRNLVSDNLVPKDQILFDLCTLDDCSKFIPKHQQIRLDGDNFVEEFNGGTELKHAILPSNQSLHYLVQDPKKDLNVTNFSSCDPADDLATRFGFRRQAEAKDWQARKKDAFEKFRAFEIDQIACLKPKAVCRIKVAAGQDLSRTASSLYEGISTLMRRDPLSVCSDAKELEFLLEGNVTVSGAPWKIGNLKTSVQTPYQSIRIVGNNATITMDSTCTNCAGAVAPAVELVGPVKFVVENLQFKSLDNPTLMRTIAIQHNGSTAGFSDVVLKNISVLAELSSATPNGFNTGLQLTASDAHIWNASIQTYYMGIDAKASQVSLFGPTGLDQNNQLRTLGVSRIQVVAPTTQPTPSPGEGLLAVKSIRGARMNDVLFYVYGTSFDGPFAIDMNGINAAVESRIMGAYNRFTNTLKTLTSRSSALYLSGFVHSTLDWSEIHSGVGGLIEFDSANSNKKATGIFNGFVKDSVVTRQKDIVRNYVLGTSNFEKDCKAWDLELKVCVL